MPQKRERDGSIRMTDEVDSSSLLLVRTHYHLLVFNIEGKDSVLLKTIDFVEGNLPLSMGVMKFEKQLFMFGGEIGFKDDSFYPDQFVIRCDETAGKPPYEGAVTNVYEFNPKTRSLESTTKIKKPMYPKINPTVGYVDDKIYVLQGSAFLRQLNLYSDCEVYDQTKDTWEPLPEIPSGFSPSNRIVRLLHFPVYFFVGCRVYVQFGVDELIFCFNCHTKEWETENAKNLENSLVKFGLSFPKVALCIYGNIILECLESTIFAFFIDNSGTIMCYQILGVLWDGITGNSNSEVSSMDSDMGLSWDESYNRGLSLVDLKSRDGRMCLVLLEEDIDDLYTIHIRHFKLKVTNVADAADADAVAVAAAAAAAAAVEAEAARTAGARASRARGDVAYDAYDACAFLESTGFLEVDIIKDQHYQLPKDSIDKYGIVTLTDAFFLED